uniref:Biotin--protein ligase-like n=1 Tax=Phallusia mammillata TaxID=59560 RepID=A0A6F9DDV7_9ASCI|nr:biotin--protein ligase-like [Phallusia mammillata]
MQSILFKSRHTMISNPFFLKARTTTSPMSVMAKTKELTKQTRKPPNILIFSPGQDPKSVSSVLCSFESCLLTDRYILYPIKFDSFCKDPWLENTELLVLWASNLFLENETHQQQVKLKIQQYLALGGKLLSFCPSVEKNISTYNNKVSEPEQVALITSGLSKLSLKNIGWSEICLNTDTNTKALVSFRCDGEDHAVVVSRKQGVTCSLSLFGQLEDNNESCLQLLKFLLCHLRIDCSSGTEPSKIQPLDLMPTNRAVLFTSSEKLRQTFFSW